VTPRRSARAATPCRLEACRQVRLVPQPVPAARVRPLQTVRVPLLPRRPVASGAARQIWRHGSAAGPAAVLAGLQQQQQVCGAGWLAPKFACTSIPPRRRPRGDCSSPQPRRLLPAARPRPACTRCHGRAPGSRHPWQLLPVQRAPWQRPACSRAAAAACPLAGGRSSPPRGAPPPAWLLPGRCLTHSSTGTCS
jgi:hypothetical protein